MDLKELERGCYTLPEPIPNPHPDKRKRDWHAQETLPAGRYVVRVYEQDLDYTAVPVRLREIQLRPAKERSYSNVTATIRFTTTDDGVSIEDHDPSGLVTALAEHFVRDDSLEAALVYASQEHHVSGRDVLLQLVDSGVLAEDTVRVTIAAVRRALEAEWEAEELQHELKLEKAKNNKKAS